MKNLDIRNYAKSKGVKQWQVAEELGVTEFAFSRQLRHELSDIDKQAVRAAVDRAYTTIQQA